MSLPSQSARTSARSSGGNYRRKSYSPAKKLLPALLVVIALVVILWYALRRPATTDASQDLQAANTNGSTPTNQPINAANQTSIPESNPVQISNSTPDRALPGSGLPNDPGQEVSNTLAAETSRTTPTNPRNSSPAGSSLLDATRNQNTPQNQNRDQPALDPQSTQTSTQSVQANPNDRVRLQLDTARRMVAQNDLVAARQLLSQTLNAPNLSVNDAQRLRNDLQDINQVLVFGPVVAPNDPMCEEYTIKSGDSLSRIAARQELATHWKLIQRINKISNPARIRLGQNLKLVRGPFHAIVHKRDHRMDIFHGSPNDPSGWIYITSLNVGLGADNGTPVGTFTVSSNKLQNPGWVNPRDASERYAPDDPANPIGEYWLGLDGVGQYATLDGYGIHGTVDPESIGDDQSMGCVRLADDDIALVYELLVERASVVEIRP
ncbi:MAG: L,D-transpeptidase family protein [Phycisphaerales bacterium]